MGHDPYLVLFSEEDCTCSVADFTGTTTGPTTSPDRTTIPPTNKKFQVEFCTVAHSNEKGEIAEERFFCDLVGLI
jgi:SnoaL-like polyketide cyclase